MFFRDYEIDYFSGSDEAIANAEAYASAPQPKSTDGKNRRHLYNQALDVTVDTAIGGWPKTITVDYGEGVELCNGRIISGKIVIVVSAPRLEDGSSREITFVDLKIDSVVVDGGSSKVFSAGEEAASGTFTLNREVTLTFPDNTWVKREGNKVREWVSGLDTKFNPADDYILITGDMEVTNSDGVEYSREITKPLVRTGECIFLTEGTVLIVKKDGTQATLDYGDGECDNKATITKDDQTKEITLGKWRRKARK